MGRELAGIRRGKGTPVAVAREMRLPADPGAAGAFPRIAECPSSIGLGAAALARVLLRIADPTRSFDSQEISAKMHTSKLSYEEWQLDCKKENGSKTETK